MLLLGDTTAVAVPTALVDCIVRAEGGVQFLFLFLTRRMGRATTSLVLLIACLPMARLHSRRLRAQVPLRREHALGEGSP